MATTAHVDTTVDTTNGTSYTSGSFTPTTGDLLVVLSYAKASATTDQTLSASANGITFTLAHTLLGDSSAATASIFVANQAVPSSPSSMTVTYDCSSDASGGCGIVTLAVSGMSKTGSTAVAQTNNDGANNLLSGQTPDMNFSSSVTTSNVVVALVGNNTNPAGLTPPTSYTERADTGFTSPNSGVEVVSRDSGETGTSISWGSTSTRGAVIAIELDTSSSGSLGGTIGVTTETDAAQPLGRRKVKAIGTALESDDARTWSLVGNLGGPIDTALEVDEAQPIGRVKRKAIGTATESDAALLASSTKIKTIGIATETDTAVTIVPSISGVDITVDVGADRLGTADVGADRLGTADVGEDRIGTVTVAESRIEREA